jgi:hypothetical protein
LVARLILCLAIKSELMDIAQVLVDLLLGLRAEELWRCHRVVGIAGVVRQPRFQLLGVAGILFSYLFGK